MGENNYLIYIIIFTPIVGICIIVLILKGGYRRKTKKNYENKLKNSNNLQEDLSRNYNNPVYDNPRDFINNMETTL